MCGLSRGSPSGNLLGGGTISQVFTVDGVNDSVEGPLDDFETAVLDRAWASAQLTSLQMSSIVNAEIGPDIDHRGFSLDNLELSPVPTPSTLGLLMVVPVLLLGRRWSRLRWHTSSRRKKSRSATG